MAVIVTRSGKGSALTHAELDANFNNLNTELGQKISSAQAPVQSVAGKTGAVTLTSSDVGLGNVENKSSATIRGEITSGNVTAALGYTPLNKGGGDSLSGTTTVATGGKLVGTDVGSVYAPGMAIQTVYLRADTKASYSAPVNSQTEIALLTTTITPKFSNSVIRVEFNLSFEIHHDTIFRLSRNGTIIGTNSTDTGRWSGFAIPGYDVDSATTPRTNHYIYLDSPGTTSAVTYRLLIGSAGATAYTLFLNRTINSAGADNNEVGISQVFLTEIAQ